MDWREKVARTSGEREADNRLSAISAMLTWAIERGHITANHLRGFKRLYHADRSEIIWLPEHVAAFMTCGPDRAAAGADLGPAQGAAARRSARLPWSAYNGSYDHFAPGQGTTRTVTRSVDCVPCTAALRRMLDGMERTSPLILTTKTGQSFKKRYFARLWDEAMTEADWRASRCPA